MTAAEITANALLRDYAVVTARQSVDALANFLAPEVPVTGLFGKFKKYSDTHRYTVPDTLRPRGEDGAFLNFQATDGTFSLEAHALNVPTDITEEMEDDATIDLMQEALDDVTEIRGLSTSSTVVQAALTEAGAGTALDFATTADPIKQIKEKIRDVAKRTKTSDLRKIRIVIGMSMEIALTTHPKVLARKSGGGKAVSVTMEEVKKMIGYPVEIMLCTYFENSAKEGLDEDVDFMLDNDLLIFVGNARASRRDNSFMKRFVLRSGWMVPRVWDLPSGRGRVAGGDWYHDIQVTNTEAVERLTKAA